MPKIVNHDEYREELMNKYFDFFARKGYSDLTMREIARELGMSTGTLYHYFPNKKSILEHLFRIASRRDVSLAVANIKEDDSLEQRIKVFVDFVFQKERYFQDIVLLTIDYFRYQDNHEDAFAILNEADNYYGKSIANGLGLDEKYGFFLAIFLNGLVYHRLVFPESVSYYEQAELFQDMMLNYFK